MKRYQSVNLKKTVIKQIESHQNCINELFLELEKLECTTDSSQIENIKKIDEYLMSLAIDTDRYEVETFT